jgi:hypothetical protein
MHLFFYSFFSHPQFFNYVHYFKCVIYTLWVLACINILAWWYFAN